MVCKIVECRPALVILFQPLAAKNVPVNALTADRTTVGSFSPCDAKFHIQLMLFPLPLFSAFHKLALSGFLVQSGHSTQVMHNDSP